MELIEELAHGIVQPYRDQQKSRIQRTFVSGSEAAGAKVVKGNMYWVISLRRIKCVYPSNGYFNLISFISARVGYVSRFTFHFRYKTQDS